MPNMGLWCCCCSACVAEIEVVVSGVDAGICCAPHSTSNTSWKLTNSASDGTYSILQDGISDNPCQYRQGIDTPDLVGYNSTTVCAPGSTFGPFPQVQTVTVAMRCGMIESVSIFDTQQPSANGSIFYSGVGSWAFGDTINNANSCGSYDYDKIIGQGGTVVVNLP